PRTVRFPRVSDLSDPVALSGLLGPVDSVERCPVGQLGYSGAAHEHLHVGLRGGGRIAVMLKRVQLSLD
ncbi:MAG TPA: hypothetical protein VFA49_09565, partial [Chloroflexota bacterium]|nr:hypothetical protein [Chloroflexota bacterium]